MYSHHSRQYLTRSVLQPRVVYLPFESLKNYRWKYARREHLHNIFTSFVYKNSTDSFKFFITRNIVHSQLLDRYWRIKIYVKLILTENSNFSFAISFHCLLIFHIQNWNPIYFPRKTIYRPLFSTIMRISRLKRKSIALLQGYIEISPRKVSIRALNDAI